jgi:hypothetical protein
MLLDTDGAQEEKEGSAGMVEIQQLKRRIDEQILQRTEADPQWRQQFLEDPDTAVGTIPEARQLSEMLESARSTEQEAPEGTMPTTTVGEEYRQVQRSFMEKVLDRAASDPVWKERLLDDPEAAIREAGFPESQQIQRIQQEREVRGHISHLEDIASEERQYYAYRCYVGTLAWNWAGFPYG